MEFKHHGIGPWFRNLHPLQILLLGYVLLIVFCTFVLMLPVSRTEAIGANLIDQLFTATSAVTTTGLVVHSTGGYTMFGQSIILLLTQIAGLSYMTFISFIILGTGKRLSFSGRMMVRESMGRLTTLDMYKFIRLILLYTLVIEGTAFIALFFLFMNYMDPGEAAFSALFHAVSAFCTSGFSLYGDSLTQFRGDVPINLIVMWLSLAGAIGFFVLYEIRVWGPRFFRELLPRRISVHSKLVLLVTGLLLGGGTAVIYFVELGEYLGPGGLLTAAFHAVMASTTTGFNSYEVGLATQGTIFLLMLLMLVGGSPGSTAGGIKTSTLGIMILFIPTVLRGKDEINLFKRRVTPVHINKAFALSFAAGLWILAGTLLLMVTEPFSTPEIMFEVTSALSTGGLSTGITGDLSPMAKVFLSVSMLVGRIGTLGIGFSLVGKAKALKYKYAEADVLIG